MLKRVLMIGFMAIPAVAQPVDRAADAERPRKFDVARVLMQGGFPELASLPLLRQGVQTHQQSSYDRAGDNYDHEYFPLYSETNGEVVVFDAYGPGLLTRQHMNIWHEDATNIQIRYYFDDERQPRIDADVSSFFSAKNPFGLFQPPWADDGGTEYRVMYAPMFFKQRLKVALSREPGGPGPQNFAPWAGRYDKIPKRRSHWYQFTYHLFTDDPGLPSWSAELARAHPAQRPDTAVWWNGQEPVLTNAFALAAGQAKEAASLAGQGCLRAVRITVEPLTAETLFGTWLKIFFDGESRPRVAAPLGALFGSHPEKLRATFAALWVGYHAEQGMELRAPMPYWKSARIVLDNQSTSNVQQLTVRLACDSAASGCYPERDTGYFHATAQRAFPRTEGRDYLYLETQGQGHLVGHIAQRWDTAMEENERTYFDGSGTPQIQGNGFEDDQGFGWGLKNKTFPLFGAPVADGGAGCLYRLFLPDLYVFYSGIRHGHQTYGPHSPRGHEGMYRIGNEQSVAFYYGVDTPALELTDELDVGNAPSEARHRYRTAGPAERQSGAYWYDGEYNNVLFRHPALADDGRRVRGASEFEVQLAADNRGIRLRRRTDKDNNRQLARVYVDGQRVTERPWYFVDYESVFNGIRWYDTTFEIPAKYTAGKKMVRLKIEHDSSEKGGLDEFYYWVYSYRR